MSLRTPLRPSRVLEALGASRFAADLRTLGVVGSTSDLLIATAERGGADGTVIVAEGQTAGRGRRGDPWVSPTGKGLWFSVLLRPAPGEDALPCLATAAGLALADAVEELGLAPRLKWPNDLIVNRAKAGGLLVDLSTRPGGESCAVIGVGLNANLEAGDLPEAPAMPATSLSLALGRLVDREALLAGVLRSLEARLGALDRGEIDALRKAWADRDALVGCRARVREGERLHEGVIMGTDPIGGVRLTGDDGGALTLHAAHARIESFDWPESTP